MDSEDGREAFEALGDSGEQEEVAQEQAGAPDAAVVTEDAHAATPLGTPLLVRVSPAHVVEHARLEGLLPHIALLVGLVCGRQDGVCCAHERVNQEEDCPHEYKEQVEAKVRGQIPVAQAAGGVASLVLLLGVLAVLAVVQPEEGPDNLVDVQQVDPREGDQRYGKSDRRRQGRAKWTGQLGQSPADPSLGLERLLLGLRVDVIRLIGRVLRALQAGL